MMKKIFKEKQFLLTILLVGSVLLSSCDSYLDEAPDNRQELKTVEDLSELLVSAYSEGTYNFIEWKTDNCVAILANTQKKWLTENFTFVPVVSEEDQDTPTYLWNKNYNAIAHSNQVLSSINDVKSEDNGKKAAIKGEALLTRAYNHFILANVFCQAYDKASANTNLGIPYITAPETALQVTYKRGTLQETYDLIEKDLLAGLSLVSNKFYVGLGKYHFNKGAAYAFASRFYLFKGDYENCIKYSNMLLGKGAISGSYCRDMNEVFTGTSSTEMANKFISPELPSNLLLVRKETSFVTRYYRGYQPTKDVFNEVYSNSVQGGRDYRDKRYGYRSGAVNPPKYNELFRYTTATTGYPYFIMPVLRAEEVILNRMEAYVMTGNSAKALIDYNIYAPTRYTNGGQLTLEKIKAHYKGSEQKAMINFIIDERRKEFFREGIRWWDIKRFKLALTHIDVQGNSFELTAEDLKKAVQIPAKAIANGIEANPR